METAEKIPPAGSPRGIAEAMELPDNHFVVKNSTNVISNRKGESNGEEPEDVEESESVTARIPVRGRFTFARSVSTVDAKKAAIDTSPPIESVKAAVSKFGGSIDWKTRRVQSFQQRPKSVGSELEISKEIPELRREAAAHGDTSLAPEELQNTQKLVEELKQDLVKAQKEEQEATQASEAARLKVEELEEEIKNEAMHVAAISDLNSVQVELETLYKEYASTVIQRDVAVKMAAEAVAASEKVEKSLACLTIVLESLELARIIHNGGINKDCCDWKTKLHQAEEKLKRLNQHVLAVNHLKSKLDESSSLLFGLKHELTSYMESKLKQEGDEGQNEVFEDLKVSVEKANAELNSSLTAIRHSEEKISVVFASLKDELDKARAGTGSDEKRVIEKMIELPKKLEQVEQELNEAKSLVQAVQIELHEAEEEAEQAKARASTMESRLLSAQKELEDAKSSEMLVAEAINTLKESESAENNNDLDSPFSGVTLGVEEYINLTKQAHEAEKQANLRVAAANSQIEMAKESELNSLNKLEEVNQELAAIRESLKMATEKAEKAKEEKLGVEKELRDWKAEQEKQRNATFEGKKEESNDYDQTNVPSDNTVTESTPETTTMETVAPETEETKAPEIKTLENNATEIKVLETKGAETKGQDKKTKKKSKFFPRLVRFFSKKKTRRHK